MMRVAIFENLTTRQLHVVIPPVHSDFEAAVAITEDKSPCLLGCVRRADTDTNSLPASRRFRECWRIAAAKVEVDLPLARQQVLAETRSERNKRLTESDGDKARLDDLGTPSQKSDIAKYRQDLRDLPARVQMDIAALDLAALEAYKPVFPTKPI